MKKIVFTPFLTSFFLLLSSCSTSQNGNVPGGTGSAPSGVESGNISPSTQTDNGSETWERTNSSTVSTGMSEWSGRTGAITQTWSGTGTSLSGASSSNSWSIRHIIEITKDGFRPANLSIRVGDIVDFVNKDTKNHWPASAKHPTHTVYPGSDIRKCGTAEQSGIFDACGGLKQGEKFEFIFNRKGTWSYHDHLNPKWYGTVTVR